MTVMVTPVQLVLMYTQAVPRIFPIYTELQLPFMRGDLCRQVSH